MEKQHHRRHDSALGGLQCLSHFFNFIMLVVGGGAAALGFWIYYAIRMDEERGGIMDILGFIYLFANLCTISEGIFLVVLVLLGTIAICTMHRCTLIWYFSLVMVACVASLAFTLMTFWVFFRMESTVNTALTDYVQKDYGLFGNEETTQLLDSIQMSFRCCGSKSYEDWHSSEWYKMQRLGYFDQSEAPIHPKTCCVLTSDGQPSNLTECVHINAVYPNRFIHREPCSEKVYDWLHWPTLYLGFAGVAMFFSAIFELGTTSALLRTLGPLEQKPKAIEKQLLTTSLHSESEDSRCSTKERPKQIKTQSKNSPKNSTLDKNKNKANAKAQKQHKINMNNRPNGNDAEGGYVNSAFRHEAEEQATPL
ncbi:CD151 antigen-like [Amphiura filiformis]|uniref:CD151 antigen-like n=1 Tax=Amphiura filiformis TaxID=82378 RepID=UPI003B2201F0